MNHSFSDRLLAWFDQYGRKDLPWQQSPTPYHVWVSEIMLQQTQVTTVIPYYQRFIKRFPDIQALAKAPLDEVLHCWTGLGYYARARNLHKSAVIVAGAQRGQLTQDLESLMSLPGIGRSTAGAILSLACAQRQPILDGNVKRVLSRVYAVDTPPGTTQTNKRLWALAEDHTPLSRVAEYTQAIMDLGATVCSRSKPRCKQCPVRADCMAFLQGMPTAYPIVRQKKSTPLRSTTMLMLQNSNEEILLEQRPPAGLWGGLWGFPECPIDQDIAQWCQDELSCSIKTPTPWETFRHTFSHFRLDITPVHIRLDTIKPGIMESDRWLWYNLDKPEAIGMAAPTEHLLQQLTTCS